MNPKFTNAEYVYVQVWMTHDSCAHYQRLFSLLCLHLQSSNAILLVHVRGQKDSGSHAHVSDFFLMYRLRHQYTTLFWESFMSIIMVPCAYRAIVIFL